MSVIAEKKKKNGYSDEIAEKFEIFAEMLKKAEMDGGYDAAALAALPSPILKRCLRLALNEKATLVDIERVHIEKLAELLSMRSGQGLDLPHSTARLSFGKLLIEPKRAKEAPADESASLPLENGIYETAFGRVELDISADFSMEKISEVEYNTKKLFDEDGMACMLDLDKLLSLSNGGEKALLIRSRRAGDRFWPVNSAFRMKLKDFFISRKVDAAERDAVPLVVFGGEIVFIPGFLISDCVKLTGETRSVLTIRFFK